MSKMLQSWCLKYSKSTPKILKKYDFRSLGVKMLEVRYTSCLFVFPLSIFKNLGCNICILEFLIQKSGPFS